jgi:integrase
MARVKLTQQYVNNPPPVPAGKAKVEHCDNAHPGLIFEQRAVNRNWGTFRMRYKNSGQKMVHITLGRSCTLTYAEAVKKWKILSAQVQLGADPQAEMQKRRKTITWAQYMETLYMPHVKAHLRSYKNLVSLNKIYVEPIIGHLPLTKITLETAQKLHRDMISVHGNSPASADHLAKFLRQAMNYAVRLDLLTSSPVSKIQMFNVDNREERLMSDKELQSLMAALDRNKNLMAKSVIRFLLLTGCRVSEALHARNSDVDFKGRSLVIQATNSKSKRRRSIPLNDEAIQLLKKLDTAKRSEWLFCSSRGDGNQRLTTIDKAWQKIRKDANLEHIRCHDLRHMAASMILNSGHSLYIVQQILGHSDPSVTQRYAHLSTATLQDAANSVGTYLNKALDKTGK